MSIHDDTSINLVVSYINNGTHIILFMRSASIAFYLLLWLWFFVGLVKKQPLIMGYSELNADYVYLLDYLSCSVGFFSFSCPIDKFLLH